MVEVRNLNGKRVCDISNDHKVIEIMQKDCITRIRQQKTIHFILRIFHLIRKHKIE